MMPRVECCAAIVSAETHVHDGTEARHRWHCRACGLDVALRESRLDAVLSQILAKVDLDPIPLYVLVAGSQSGVRR